MLAQAAGYAVLGAISPAALLVAAIFLASASPRRAALFFLCGAVLVTVVVAIVLLLVLRGAGLNMSSQHQPRYGLRLGLGVLALGVSFVLARRKPRPPDPARKPSLVMRLSHRPGPAAAFAVGLLVFIPSVTYVAAVQVIATSHAGVAIVVLGLVVVVAIDIMFAWLPLLLFLAAPVATTHWLRAFDGWLKAHGHTILVAGSAIAGLALICDGIAGLAG